MDRTLLTLFIVLLTLTPSGVFADEAVKKDVPTKVAKTADPQDTPKANDSVKPDKEPPKRSKRPPEIKALWVYVTQIKKLTAERRTASDEQRDRLFEEIADLRDQLHEQAALVGAEIENNPSLLPYMHTLLKVEAKLIRQTIRTSGRENKRLRKKLDRAIDFKEVVQLEGQLSDRKARLVGLLSNSLTIAEVRTKLGEDTQVSLKKFDELLIAEADASSELLEELSTRLAKVASDPAVIDEKEKMQRKALIGNRLKEEAQALRTLIALAEKRELDTSAYSQKLIETTGEFTSDVLEWSVMERLASKWKQKVEAWVFDKGPGLIFKLLILFLILGLARLAQKLVVRLADKSLGKVPMSVLAKSFLVKTIGRLVFVIGLVIALSQLGIDMGAFIAGLGIAGFIIGFALQDTLSNFASGMMILIYKPYDVGDLIEVATIFGTVSHMSLVSTHVTTLDNQSLVVPNNKIWQEVIRNVTALELRRVDLMFGIDYGDDFEQAEAIIKGAIAENPAIKTGEQRPENTPVVRLHELGDSSLNIVMRAWTDTAEYWNVYWYMLREVKKRFDAEGISIPFPQRDVHMIAPPQEVSDPSAKPKLGTDE